MNKLLGSIAVCALAGNAMTALAATESVSFTVPLPDVDESFFIAEGDFGGSTATPIDGIPKFDGSLGTLVDVKITFEYSFFIETFIQAEGILDGGIPHQANWSAGQVALGVTFFSTAVDPPTFNILGEVIPDYGVGCFGNPGDGEACSDFFFDEFSGGAFEVSLINNILLDDFVGTGTYDGFTFEFDVLDSIFDLENVATAFVDIIGTMNTGVTFFTIEYIYETGAADTDGDGVDDGADNCIDTVNPSQLDADADDYGNACDADTNNDCIVNVLDLGNLKAGFFGTDSNLDFNGDGAVNAIDLGVMKANFFGVPGPSGLTDACAASRAAGNPTVSGTIRDAATGLYIAH